jgi:hypothetical protein
MAADFTFCCSARTFRSVGYFPKSYLFSEVLLVQKGLVLERRIEIVCSRNVHANRIRKKDGHMRTCRILLGLALSIGSSIAVLCPAFSQQHPGTMEQQLACTPDVWRLCSEHIPDVDRIVVCLRQNTPRLSGPCRAVFESNNSSPDPAVPRRRDDRARSHQ